ncbi:organic cation/carnitine transporter 2-like [Ciona intestinalis]
MFCDGNWKKTFALTLFMLGKMIGGLIGGTLSDKFGKKLVFLAFTFVQFSTSVIIGFATNYQVYAAMMFLCGCGGLVNYYAAFTLGSEVVGKRHRNLICACLSMGYAVGYMITPAFGYFLRNWRWYCRVTGFIGLLYLPYYWLLDESPVWLESKGKSSEAAKIRAKIAKYNGKNLTKNEEENMTLNPNFTPGEGIIKSWFLIFKNCQMVIRISIVCFGWCMSSITYFAIALDTNSLSGNRFLNCFYAGLVELVAYLISFGAVEVCGPKNIYIISMLAASGSVIVTPFIKLWSAMAMSVITMAGKLFVGVGFYVACIMTAELFPTSIRNSVVAVAAASSKLGGVLAPLFIYNADEGDNWIPYVVVGLFIALSALLFLLLPKSRHQNLPRNVEEAANMKSSNLPSCCCANHKSESLSEE